MGLILLIIVILLLVGALPTWGYSRRWGYGPTGVLGFILLIVLILLLMGTCRAGSEPHATTLPVSRVRQYHCTKE
jgi:hypothetical protein